MATNDDLEKRNAQVVKEENKSPKQRLKSFSFRRGSSGSGKAKTTIIDAPVVHVRRPRDLLDAVYALLGVAAIVLLTVYAHSTTEGIQNDLHEVYRKFSDFFLVPFSLFQAFVAIVIPAVLLFHLVSKRQYRQIVAAGIAFGLAVLFASMAIWGILEIDQEELTSSFTAVLSGVETITIPTSIAGLAGTLSASGPRRQSRAIKGGWNLLWFAIAVLVVSGQVALAGAVVSVLLGRLAGLLTRYLFGVQSERAYGKDLLTALTTIGLDPQSLTRVMPSSSAVNSELVVESKPSSVEAITQSADARAYILHQEDGRCYDVVVLDSDRHLLGNINRLWNSLRIRGFQSSSTMSLRTATEHAALMYYSAANAGVSSPKLTAVSRAKNSSILVLEHLPEVAPINSYQGRELTDEVLADLWRQLLKAHAAGITHRKITDSSLLISKNKDAGQQCWITGWESGEIATSSLSKLIDRVQLLTLMAIRVGSDRAVAAALKSLTVEQVISLGPLLQTVVLPAAVKNQLSKSKSVLSELREALLDLMPESVIEQANIKRFSAKSVFTLAATLVALYVVFTQLNAEQLSLMTEPRNLWYLALAFAIGLGTWLGGTLTLVAFSPAKLPFLKVFLVQVAASFLALVTPSGVGAAAFNLRVLNRHGVKTSIGVATVALIQVAQFLVTLLLLFIMFAFNGDDGALQSLPSDTLGLVALAVLGVVGILFTIPQTRGWILKKWVPTLRQIWPPLIEVLGSPWRMTVGLLGNVLITLSFVFAFQVCLYAFGIEASLLEVSVVYLLGNTLGSMAPTPGGLGTIEAALIAAATTGLGASAASVTSAVILFRLATYWARIPFGWLSMRYLQNRGDL